MKTVDTAMPALFVQVAVTIVLVAGALVAYDKWMVRPALLIGLVDVAEVYRDKEAEFTAAITRATTSEERQKAFTSAQLFAKRLPVALDELPQECRCLVVVRSSVAGTPPYSVDLTAKLKQKVDMP